MAHGLSSSTACGIVLEQGANQSPLHWKADCSPLDHQRSPNFFKLFILKYYKLSLSGFFFFFSWPHHKACRISVPWAGSEPEPLHPMCGSLNPGTAMELIQFYQLLDIIICKWLIFKVYTSIGLDICETTIKIINIPITPKGFLLLFSPSSPPPCPGNHWSACCHYRLGWVF